MKFYATDMNSVVKPMNVRQWNFYVRIYEIELTNQHNADSREVIWSYLNSSYEVIYDFKTILQSTFKIRYKIYSFNYGTYRSMLIEWS